jgi:DNA-binding transcriptional LysR family regulator
LVSNDGSRYSAQCLSGRSWNSAASRQLRLSPAAISKNIGEFEAHLGARLLNRTTRRLSRTEAGARYYDSVVRILDEMAEADAALGPLQVMSSGLLRVAAPMTLTLIRLSAAMPLRRQRNQDPFTLRLP